MLKEFKLINHTGEFITIARTSNEARRHAHDVGFWYVATVWTKDYLGNWINAG